MSRQTVGLSEGRWFTTKSAGMGLFPSALDDSIVPVLSRHRRTWPSPCPGQGIAPVCEPWDNLTRVAARLSPLECIMAPIDDVAVYDDLLDLLAESADAERVLAFRLSAAK